MATIRRAQPAEAELLASYNVAMARETESLELDERTVQQGVAALLQDASKGTYFVAEEGGHVVAQLMITYEWSDWRNAQMWWIQSVYVHPAHRKRGLFRQLYAHAKAQAQAAGAGGLRLYVDKSNSRAQATYEAMGMRCHYAMYEDNFGPH